MNIVTNVKALRDIRGSLKNQSVGFVPTMGHLHEGHLALCRKSSNENDITIVSIFVNPTQFNNNDDFTHYPRTVDADLALLKKEKIDYVFLPEPQEMYHDNYEVQVAETQVSKELEGEFRPGHFHGMLTVVLKLLNLVQATKAYFGEKDYQQLMLIKKMASAFFLPTEIVGCETVRAENGLALSSRNSRLTEEEREIAATINVMLKSSLSDNDVRLALENKGFKVEYVVKKWQRRLIAAWLGKVRLIDNVSYKIEG